MSSYTFAPLQSTDHFRLISILPDAPASPLQCTISEFPLDAAPAYEALSYAWGGGTTSPSPSNPNATPTILLNGRAFAITRGLEEALRRLRGSEAERRVWIDAICINQADNGERSAQVARMRDIYRGAARVVAWLGEESADSGRAMRFLRTMATENWEARFQRMVDEAEAQREEEEKRNGDDAGSGRSSDENEDDEEVDCDAGGGGAEADVKSEPESSGSSAQEETDSPALSKPASTTSHQSEHSAPSATEPEEDEVSIESPAESFTQPPSASDEHTRRWNLAHTESIANQRRRGHILNGVPVLYNFLDEPKYETFFTDARQADWEALDALLARAWWARTWVVQEVWLSRATVLQCGPETMDWETFTQAMDYQEAWDDIGTMVQKTARWAQWTALKRRYGLAIHISKKRLLGCGLADLLWNIWDRESTDPRDKVYAVLGLVGGGGTQSNGEGEGEDNDKQQDKAPDLDLPTIDYSKTFHQVYQETASCIQHPDTPTHTKLPSWVPDWRKQANEHRPALFINGNRMHTMLYWSGSTSMVLFHGHGYCASGEETETYARFSADLTVLHVRGIVLSSVADVGVTYADGARAGDIVAETLAQVRRSGIAVEGSTSAGDGTGAGVGEGEGEGEVVDEKLLKQVLRGSTLVDGFALKQGEWSAIENVMKRRRFFVSAAGHLCIGPARAQRGDVVAVIAGCNFPMVLRPQGADAYALVGEAYVHNNMAGEVLKEKEPEWVEMSLH
ncbi:heterokaryon incompatibility protein-domain-containing protein [Whalleya microplaca]|nr:heterokaryon incompatibility protein-domain-containing protein [Whalleya microplaca]